MEREYLLGLTVENIQDNILMIKNMDMVFFNGKTVENTKENG